MTIPPRFLDELRSRLTLSEIIGQKVSLTRAGREFKACCPFHNEKTASFTVNDDKQFYHCFGCGAHGSVIDFAMQMENLSFIESVEALAAQAGVGQFLLGHVPDVDEEQAQELAEIVRAKPPQAQPGFRKRQQIVARLARQPGRHLFPDRGKGCGIAAQFAPEGLPVWVRFGIGRATGAVHHRCKAGAKD